MKVLLIPDSFKGSMSAEQVALVMKNAVKRVFPESSCKLMPFSDGGEGALKVLENHAVGRIRKCKATDALSRPVDAYYFCFKDQKSAWIELSKTAGLAGLSTTELNPLNTSTWGTGKMILNALEQGCSRIYLGIGGSATHDFGSGIISALNGFFLDKKNKRLPHGGGAISQLNRIDLSQLDARVSKTEWIIACDVENQLLGKQGAAHTYAHQKGASVEMIDQLEFAGNQFANVVEDQYGVDVRSIKGGGAAGGVSAGLYGLLGARLERGFDLLAELTGVDQQIGEMDLVLTGEGAFDGQSLFGKLPFKVAQLTQNQKIPTLIVAGQTSMNQLPDMSHVKVYNSQPEHMPLDEALKKAPHNLEVKLLEVLEAFKLKNKKL